MGRPNATTGCAARAPRAALSGAKDLPSLLIFQEKLALVEKMPSILVYKAH
jgi:hypothetical protein